MFPAIPLLKKQLFRVIEDKDAQGHATEGLMAELDALPDSYDAAWAFARRLAALPLREDWPFVEPNDLAGIRAESDWPEDPSHFFLFYHSKIR